jgi:hypothetical protein
MRKIITVAALAASVLTPSVATALATQSPAASAAHPSGRCAHTARGTADGRTSLLIWSTDKGSTIAGTIYWTLQCEHGLQQPFVQYLDGGNDRRPVPAGIHLFTAALEPVSPVR